VHPTPGRKEGGDDEGAKGIEVTVLISALTVKKA